MFFRVLASLTLGAIMLCTVAKAASFDPSLTWRTLKTPHFNITFHQGEAALAEEVAGVAEAVYDKMSAELATAPKRPTELVLIDPTDMANGYATPIPVNTIVIFVTAPNESSVLSQYENWNDALLTHEFTHTLHLDTIEGLPKLLRLALGRVVNVHRTSPGWMIEGLATLQETRHTSGGRGRSNVADMVKRMATLEDEFPPLGNMEGFQVSPPSGNLRYLFGQDFMQYIADTAGENVWTKWLHGYGGGFPYWLPTKRVFGKRLVPLYKDWREQLKAKYGAQAERIRAAGETKVRMISDGISSCMGPTWSPNGETLVYSCADPSTGAAIKLHQRGEAKAEIALKGAFAQDFTWRADSEAFFFSANHKVNNFNLYDDLYFHQLGHKTAKLLTRGKRVRQPTLSPDGRDLLMIRNKVQQNQLARFSVDQELDVLTDFKDHTQLANPVFSPDGRFLAMSVWAHGVRDIWIYGAEGQPYRRVTADNAHDMDPVWSADGRWLYFSSDRSGIFNIYAIELATETVHQVTNVLGGAFHPAPHPDGTTLTFESFSNNGPDVVETSLAKAHWTQRGLLPSPLLFTGSLADTQALNLPPAPPPSTGTLETIEGTSTQNQYGHPRLPSGIARTVPIVSHPALQGYGGPFSGFSKLPVFSNPWLDTPQTGPDVEEAEIESEDEHASEEDFEFSYPVTRYNPNPTLFPPRYLMPGATLAYGDTLMAMVSTSSWDTLMRWFYGGFVSYRSDNNYVGWGVSAAYNKLEPVISAGAYSYTVRYGPLFLEPPPPSDGGTWTRSIEQTSDSYFDKRTQTYLNVSMPLGGASIAYVKWAGLKRSPLVPLSHYEKDGERVYRPGIPTRGYFSSIGAGWGKGKGTAYGRAVSVEKGTYYSVSSKMTSSYLGSTILDEEDNPKAFSQLQFGAEFRRYVPMPWLDNHVFSAKFSGGGTIGDRNRFGSFRLGGNFGLGGLYTLPSEYRPLRGFEPGTVYGDWYYLASFEYLLPLWWIDRGVGTVPLFARYFALAPFLDAGHAFDALPNGDEDQEPMLPNTLVGTGMELRGAAIIGYGVSLTMRVGYGFALRGPGVPFGSPNGLYVRFDTGF